MFTKISTKKGTILFKERSVADIVKEYTQRYDLNVLGPENPNFLTPNKSENHLELWTSSSINDAVKLKGKNVLPVIHIGDTDPGNTLHHQLYP